MTWRPVRVDRAGDRFRATLPELAAGQAMSLRVAASGSAGSRIDQTMVAAYRA